MINPDFIAYFPFCFIYSMWLFLQPVSPAVWQPEKCWTESTQMFFLEFEELKVSVPNDHGLVLENVKVGSCLQILAPWRNLTGTAKERARHQCRKCSWKCLYWLQLFIKVSQEQLNVLWINYCNDQAEICSIELVSLILKTSLLAQERIAFNVMWVPLESHFL